MMRFAFDLDCTLTLADTYTVLAGAFGLEAEVRALTEQALNGGLDFHESLRRRFTLMSAISPAQVRALFDKVPLDPDLTAFINARPERCAVITNNLDIWMPSFSSRLACRFYTSRAVWHGERTEVVHLLDKGKAAKEFRGEDKLAAIGDSLADLPMFAQADFSIQHAAVHKGCPELLLKVNRQTHSGAELAALLEGLAATESVH